MYARDHAIIATPIGFVRIEGDESISRIAIDRDGAAKRASSAAVRAAANQLQEYFAGERITFDLPLAPLSTPRGEALRAAIVAVAAGETASYGAVATRIGSSARAIGQACRKNPLPIVVPCHRIVGGSGHYSAGEGIATKNWLLDHERRFARIDG
ncbi:methylated-DNA--[protein]-cysteine S-methyltransferase [Sphingomonas sp. SUN019]|uniref:methylated-DNA--[protein]-cysteine S-methyltransferase n=1 Tax=Sphingomonas sp. SUN019 TaxID=2937788 RepID=UPI0021646014|nr:methylated-DNA--[protein]-cysteine S-methyltransferase [Sphingomonas sp. SUN019]UVO52494.1 methylated-DNA--[protein]-cysteine S-methyltransferase [Sphingomonas sp. SUN019]